ncbi:hypothetical protein B0H13DRAFT_1877447 [Mycena leptocephala]|nr:hypothetical protein B0H13DRAFT_1877447 [Mycena leptocephala]
MMEISVYSLSPCQCASQTKLSSEVGAGINHPHIRILPSPNHTPGPEYTALQPNLSRFSAARNAEPDVPKASSCTVYLSTSARDVEHSSQIVYSAQTRRGTRKVGSEPPQARALARMHEARERNAPGMVTVVRMDCFGRFRGRRRRNERETQRESAGAASVLGLGERRLCGCIQCPVRECMMHHIGVRSGQREVLDVYIDKHGCQGNAPSMSAHRCVEKPMT